MQLIASDRSNEAATMLDALDDPAILVDSEYRIIAANDRYTEAFGQIDAQHTAHCYEVSHGYSKPCDQAGESCPLSACRQSGRKERVLHIHNTPRGREHVDVEMLPIHDDTGEIRYFVELLKPVAHASATGDSERMVGASPAFNHVLDLINRVAPSEASILLLGESGTGKELAAKAIHQASARRDKPFVTVECAGLTDALFESELFGHLKGAFTGASFTKKGLVEAAEGGTLFLDEVGDIPLHLQVKLLRLIETGTFRPVGSVEPRTSDFRLVCATHKNLKQMIHEGLFREDLYYRINAFPIHLPSLNERREDIPMLADAILQKLQPKPQPRLSPDGEAFLQRIHYEGNIRELRNILQRALLLGNSREISADTLRLCTEEETQNDSRPPYPAKSKHPDLKTLEKQYLQQLMSEFDGNKTEVARAAGISLRTLYRKLEE